MQASPNRMRTLLAQRHDCVCYAVEGKLEKRRGKWLVDLWGMVTTRRRDKPRGQHAYRRGLVAA